MAGTVKVKQVVESDVYLVDELQPPRADLDGWFRSDYTDPQAPDNRGFEIDSSTVIEGFSTGELNDPSLQIFGDSTLGASPNATYFNRLEFSGTGVITQIKTDTLEISFASGVCGICALTGRKFYLNDPVGVGYAITGFKPIALYGAVMIGDNLVVNSSLGAERVRV